jgi:uncharacterized protein YbaA (DUF1428 family)
MPRYADGFVLALPKKNLDAYRRVSRKAGKIWKEYGAIEYVECIGDDLKVKSALPFPRLAKLKAGEVVVFSWILYKSRAQRDRINKKIMRDPRLKLDVKTMPFDMNRMAYGGFEVLVDL